MAIPQRDSEPEGSDGVAMEIRAGAETKSQRATIWSGEFLDMTGADEVTLLREQLKEANIIILQHAMTMRALRDRCQSLENWRKSLSVVIFAIGALFYWSVSK